MFDVCPRERLQKIHKKGDRQNVSNHRSGPLLPVLSKVFERLTYKTMLQHFFKNEVISPNQASVEVGNSCINQYFKEVTHEIYKRFKNKLEVFLDVFEPVALHKKMKFSIRHFFSKYTLSKCLCGHPILHWRLRLNLKAHCRI